MLHSSIDAVKAATTAAQDRLRFWHTGAAGDLPCDLPWHATTATRPWGANGHWAASMADHPQEAQVLLLPEALWAEDLLQLLLVT